MIKIYLITKKAISSMKLQQLGNTFPFLCTLLNQSELLLTVS